MFSVDSIYIFSYISQIVKNGVQIEALQRKKKDTTDS